MRYVKWTVIVVLFTVLFSSFINLGTPTTGLHVGDTAPDFQLSGSDQSLSSYKGHYVLLSFWASYDASSRQRNAAFSNAVQQSDGAVRLVSVSFDEYPSIFRETIRQDHIQGTCCVETEGRASEIFEEYELERGFGNYLLDGNGTIVAKNIAASQLQAYVACQPTNPGTSPSQER